MADILLTKYKDFPVVAAYIDNRLEFLSIVHETKLKNIFLCRVENIVKNINSAFVRYDKDKLGYVHMKDILPSSIVNREVTDKAPLRQGDEIILQLETEAIKTKKGRLTSYLSVPGKYCVLTLGRSGVGASKKLDDTIRRELISSIQDKYSNILNDSKNDLFGAVFGLIIRTEAAFLPKETQRAEIEKDLKDTLAILKSILSEGRTRTVFSCLYDSNSSDLSSHVEKAKAFLRSKGIEEYKIIESSVIYNISNDIGKCLRSKVWLDSGAYLIIEQLESFNAIDVNSGKAITGKKDIISRINHEAATEIMRQIRLRNLSGMILIDFINMKNADDTQNLCEYLSALASKDPVHTQFIDITGLGIVELTRNKNDKSLKELLSPFLC
ncbi:MAG: ribonuclease E/G [Butyrivibrio sp.]|nr:ribonuclease E/G [Butyrivibrio sp.]